MACLSLGGPGWEQQLQPPRSIPARPEPWAAAAAPSPPLPSTLPANRPDPNRLGQGGNQISSRDRMALDCKTDTSFSCPSGVGIQRRRKQLSPANPALCFICISHPPFPSHHENSPFRASASSSETRGAALPRSQSASEPPDESNVSSNPAFYGNEISEKLFLHLPPW